MWHANHISEQEYFNHLTFVKGGETVFGRVWGGGRVSLQKKTPFPPFQRHLTPLKPAAEPPWQWHIVVPRRGKTREGGGGRQRRSNLECASEGKFLFRLLRRTHAGDAGSLLPSITHQSRGLDGQTELLHCVPIMISQSPRIPAPESPAGFAG